MIVNKLSPWIRKYRCADDCKLSGCPGHKAIFEYFSTSDSFHLCFGKNDIFIDINEMELLKEYIEDLTSDN